MKIKTTLLFLSFFFSAALFSQKKAAYNPEFLIPYNDHGKWGYCDTLGEIIVKPAYEKASFIYKNRTTGELRGFLETKVGDNVYMVSEDKLLIPKKYGYTGTSFYVGEYPNGTGYYFILDKNEKLGLFDIDNRKVLQKPAYDSVSWQAAWKDFFLFKNKGDETYFKYNLQTNKIESTDIKSIKSYYSKNGYNNKIVAVHQDGSHSELKDGKMIPFTLTADWWEDMGLTEAADEMFRERNPMFSVNPSKPQPDAELKTFDFSNYESLVAKYGFKKLIAVRKNNKLGIVDDQGKEQLPAIYDKLEFEASGSQVQLFKDGKVGRKIFFTHYPIIEAKYDEVVYEKSLRVTEKWTFALFAVKLNGQKGFVGENSIEYFDLD